MTELEEFDVVAKLNPNGQPHYDTCTLVCGDGTMKVAFTHGRARVNAEQARVLAANQQVNVIGYPPVPVEPVDAPARRPRRPAPAEPVEPGEEPEAAVDAAEVEDAPALEALTPDGVPRCQAVKADGTQCSNPATDGDACNLPPHRAQRGIA